MTRHTVFNCVECGTDTCRRVTNAQESNEFPAAAFLEGAEADDNMPNPYDEGTGPYDAWRSGYLSRGSDRFRREQLTADSRRAVTPKYISDTHRINWLEARKYITTGLGFDGGKACYKIRFANKRFFGHSLRTAIDKAMNLEGSRAIEPITEPPPVEYAKVKQAMDQIGSAVRRYGLTLVIDMDGNYNVEDHVSAKEER